MNGDLNVMGQSNRHHIFMCHSMKAMKIVKYIIVSCGDLRAMLCDPVNLHRASIYGFGFSVGKINKWSECCMPAVPCNANATVCID